MIFIFILILLEPLSRWINIDFPSAFFVSLNKCFHKYRTYTVMHIACYMQPTLRFCDAKQKNLRVVKDIGRESHCLSNGFSSAPKAVSLINKLSYSSTVCLSSLCLISPTDLNPQVDRDYLPGCHSIWRVSQLDRHVAYSLPVKDTFPVPHTYF